MSLLCIFTLPYIVKMNFMASPPKIKPGYNTFLLQNGLNSHRAKQELTVHYCKTSTEASLTPTRNFKTPTMSPSSIPNVSLMTFARGAKQFVVQDALLQKNPEMS